MNRTNYRNLVSKKMVYRLLAGTWLSVAGSVVGGKLTRNSRKSIKRVVRLSGGLTTLGLGLATVWAGIINKRFAPEGKRNLSGQLNEELADYIRLPKGGKGLDVGCGLGSLTIACARRNPDAEMVGVDFGMKASESVVKKLCERNAQNEGVSNVSFFLGQKKDLEFEDSTFDAVTGNLIFHNAMAVSRTEAIGEALRLLKKDGVFAFHIILTKKSRGKYEALIERLKEEGFADARLIRADDGLCMTKKEAFFMRMSGSTLLVGVK